MRVIVIAGGSGTRWGNHTGVPKHLAVLAGERLLDRTVRLFRPHGEVIVVGPDDPRYRVSGAGHWIPTLDASNGDADKFLSSRELWSATSRTIVAYGDVWFSEAAVETIVSPALPDWRTFGRCSRSRITGTPWGELFAFAFDPHHRRGHLGALMQIVVALRRGRLRRNGGWEWYRALEGLPLRLKPNRVGPHFVEIDDLTDDLDFPADHERLAAAIERELGIPA